MSEQDVWTEVDQYYEKKLLPHDASLEAVLQVNVEAGLPAHDVSPAQGKLLYLLAKIKGAQNVLEIGTLGGYSTIWLARALPDTGKVITLEADPNHANVAKQNFQRAGCAGKIEVLVGNALDTLPVIKQKGHSFDLIFIDADKQNNPNYLQWALSLANSGALIFADNIVRNGEVADQQSTDDRVRGIHQFADLLEQEPRIESTAVQTVGQKGYDGFIIGYVK